MTFKIKVLALDIHKMWWGLNRLMEDLCRSLFQLHSSHWNGPDVVLRPLLFMFICCCLLYWNIIFIVWYLYCIVLYTIKPFAVRWCLINKISIENRLSLLPEILFEDTRELSETLIWKRTDNTMTKAKRRRHKETVHKILNRKLKTDNKDPTKTGLNKGDSERKQFLSH